MAFFLTAIHVLAMLSIAAGEDDTCPLLQTARGPKIDAWLIKNLYGKLYTVCRAPFVLCSDAECAAPVKGYASCTCNVVSSPSLSIIPTSMSGAPLVEGRDASHMCAKMKHGELYSTFGSAGDNPMPPARFARCSPKTSFAYCWGAKCEADSTNSSVATCYCPMTDSKSPFGDQLLAIPEDECSSEDPCKDTWNSAPSALYKTVLPPIIADKLVCYDYKA
eukprot:TRINITY_DN56146_c0_g1_i1.p1 TRINITY_DN56146_c0_g1~~TRINITY_DN56146_c0_g1_i1.p1  ORF type:complete len:220 (+),score=19.66 TRINITY_DN56146_c0_g1_i1:131-790(+)